MNIYNYFQWKVFNCESFLKLFNISCEIIYGFYGVQQKNPSCHVSTSCRNIIGAINNYRNFRSLPWGNFVAWDARYDTWETLRYAPFSENTIPRDKILFLAAVVHCISSSCQDLEVTESCQVSALDGRCGAISPNKVDVRRKDREREKEAGRGKREMEGMMGRDEGHRMGT